MAKPRIIIADTDVVYAIVLQRQFAAVYSDQIDLEVITSGEYFDSLFSTPQIADILIVSDALYTTSLQRHNITCIFLMTEEYEPGQTTELNVEPIFKYASVHSILSEIRIKCGDILPLSRKHRKVSQIILVCSACGGVGKTTVAMGLSACLTRMHKHVLYLNAGRLQCFGHLLENAAPITDPGVYASLTAPSGTIYADIRHVLREERFTYLPPFRASLLSLSLQYTIFEQIALAAKQSYDFDYIVVDAESTFDKHTVRLMEIADTVFVVTEQSRYSVSATNALAENLSPEDNSKFLFLCNNFIKEDHNALRDPRTHLWFPVVDYIGHFSHYDRMYPEHFAQDKAMNRIAYLVL